VHLISLGVENRIGAQGLVGIANVRWLANASAFVDQSKSIGAALALWPDFRMSSQHAERKNDQGYAQTHNDPPVWIYEAKLVIATISIGMPTTLSAASLVNLEVIHANAGPKTDPGFLSWILTFTERLEFPTVNAASNSGRRSTCWQRDVSEEPRDEASKIGNGASGLMEIDLRVKQTQRKWWGREEQVSGRVSVKH
jgi:hypothetical protein